MQLGDKVKQIRKSFGYSQEKLANLVGVSLVSVSRIERNEQPPSLAFIANFSKVCNVSVDSLLEIVRKNEEADTLELKKETIADSMPVTSHSNFVDLVYKLSECADESEKYHLTKKCIASYMQLLDEKNRISSNFEKINKLVNAVKKGKY